MSSHHDLNPSHNWDLPITTPRQPKLGFAITPPWKTHKGICPSLCLTTQIWNCSSLRHDNPNWNLPITVPWQPKQTVFCADAESKSISLRGGVTDLIASDHCQLCSEAWVLGYDHRMEKKRRMDHGWTTVSRQHLSRWLTAQTCMSTFWWKWTKCELFIRYTNEEKWLYWNFIKLEWMRKGVMSISLFHDGFKSSADLIHGPKLLLYDM